MRSPRPALLALVALCLLFWGAVRPAASQAGDGAVLVATDYELIGTSELSGGGHVTWTLTGAEARELRAKIVGMFDEYVSFPRGFPFYPSGTRLTSPNGLIDAEEALAYTQFLEQVLEGTQRGRTGLQVGYFRMGAADLLYADDVYGSTSGLVGTGATSTEDLQIRFYFDGRTVTSDDRVTLPTKSFADALHAMFSFEGRQFANMTPTPWPLLAEDGWHVVPIDGRAALWAGNLTTGRYDNDTAAVTRSAPIDDIAAPWIDLRFATTARVEFSYRGEVADGNDVLRLEVAPGSAYSAWNSTALPETAGVWTNRTVDLSAYVGEKVRLRLNFTSDGAGAARGFYVRDFAILAPSTYEGAIVERTAHYLIGTLSFSEPSVGSGTLNVIRTPGGEILFYDAAWGSDAPPADGIRFQILNALENPQALFAVMIVASYFISRSQEVAYDRYREAHTASDRPAVRKARWLHGIGKGVMGLLILLYFVPTALYNIGLRVFVAGSAYWFLALILALGLGFGTRAYYRQRLRAAVPLAPAEQGAPAAGPGLACTHCLRQVLGSDRSYRCACGSLYHLSCASGLAACASCRRPISVEVVPKRRAMSVRCQACGEVQAVPEGADPRTIPCEACGSRLQPLEDGKGYLLIATNPAPAVSWLQDLTKAGRPALCLTTAAPERLRLEFGLKGIELLQVSASEPKAIDPAQLDPVGLRPILSLSRAERHGVILYDGLDEMVNASSLGDVIRFLRKANDMAFVHGMTVLARIAPGSLPASEMERLAKEFDESIDLTARR